MSLLLSSHSPKYLRAHPVGPYGDAYDYAWGEHLDIHRGMFVRVPLGRQEVTAVVIDSCVHPTIDPARIKNISATYMYALTADFLTVLEWVSTYNVVPLGQFLKATLGGVDLDHCYRPIKPKIPRDAETKPLTLNAIQENAFQIIKNGFAAGTKVALLDGVTGSGKTEVYVRHVYDAWLLGKQVLVCVPEIGLTPAWISRFEGRFAADCVVWHSRMTPAQRYRVWTRVVRGDPLVVIATRSGSLLPFANLSLIVMDEEHDGSYKQEESPVYHGRDVILARSHFEQVDVILSTATPSLETYHHTLQAKYVHAKMPERVGVSTLPSIETIDMRQGNARTDGDTPERWLHPKVLVKIKETLDRQDQVFLFLNRRGYAPLVMCGSCGHRVGCPQCSTSLVLHTTNNTLRCHHCGFLQTLLRTCPSCLSEALLPCGPGIERLESYVHKYFPGTHVAVVSSDHLRSPREMEALLADVEANKIRLLIGTQMLAKGHHFPNLTCVCVVDADAGLMSEDWRACEKTYQLIHQVAGRAGRAEKAGHVYIQSYQPEHPVLQALCTHDRDAIYRLELDQREQGNLPPFGRMMAVVVSATSLDMVTEWVRRMRDHIPLHPDVQVLGPAPAPLEKIRNHYRWRFLFRAPSRFPLSKYAATWMQSLKFPRALRIKLDMDPQNFL
ncbi:MAG: primosomal protein N' [Alphaproteobacteria bacterium]|nr:MAG: primosomal protein N' [Alphaproteobacteria bacterium]